MTDASGVAADTWGMPAVINQDYSHEQVRRGPARHDETAAPPARPDEGGGPITFAADLEAWLRGGCLTLSDATIRLG